MSTFHIPPVARRWRIIAAVAGISALAGGGVLLAAPSDAATALAFHTVPTVRVLDTRPATQVGTRSTPLGVADSLSLVIPGLPDDATAVNLNVTVVDGTEGSFLTVFPTGDVRPVASTVNWDSAAPVANNATVVVHSAQSVTLYNLKGTVNVVIDLLGYYAPSPAGGGAPGAPGAPGTPAPTTAYFYASNGATEALDLGSSVTFDTVGLSRGDITMATGSAVEGSQFEVHTAGHYRVSFSVFSIDDNQFSVVVNGTTTAATFGSIGAERSQGTIVLNLLAAQSVTLTNLTSTGDPTTGDGTVTLGGQVGGSAPTPNAWIMIEQL